MSSSDAERYQARFTAPGHPWPDLVINELGHLWIGPKRHDFAEPLILGVEQHLSRCKQSNTRTDCNRWVVLRLGRLPSDPTNSVIAQLELCYEEGIQILERRAKAAVPPPPPLPGEDRSFDSEDLEARRRAIEAAKKNLSRKLGGTADATPTNPSVL